MEPTAMRPKIFTRIFSTVEPWFDKPLFNKVLGIMDSVLTSSNNKIHGKEPHYTKKTLLHWTVIFWGSSGHLLDWSFTVACHCIRCEQKNLYLLYLYTTRHHIQHTITLKIKVKLVKYWNIEPKADDWQGSKISN